MGHQVREWPGHLASSDDLWQDFRNCLALGFRIDSHSCSGALCAVDATGLRERTGKCHQPVSLRASYNIIVTENWKMFRIFEKLAAIIFIRPCGQHPLELLSGKCVAAQEHGTAPFVQGLPLHKRRVCFLQEILQPSRISIPSGPRNAAW